MTKSSSTPVLTAGPKPAITASPARTDQSKEMYNAPILMCMLKYCERYRLPENVSSENDEETMYSNATDDHQKNTTSIESKDTPVTNDNVLGGSAVEMIQENPFTVNNNGFRWFQKSENASCMENENIALDFLDSTIPPSITENKNFDKVDSSENVGNELEKVWETNQWGRSYANGSSVMEKSRVLRRVSRILTTFLWKMASQPTC